MVYSYLKIALRNLVRQRGYAFTNVAGLAALLLALLSVGYQALKAARPDPVQAPRYG